MVIANDTPYSGSHTDPLHLKHAAATKLALTIPFDGEPCNVHRFKSDTARENFEICHMDIVTQLFHKIRKSEFRKSYLLNNHIPT
jgi:hypothetical protein